MYVMNDITQLYSNTISIIYYFFDYAALVNKMKKKMKNEIENKMQNRKYIQQSYIAEDADC